MDPELVATRMREAHPEAEPFEIDAETARRWVSEAGGEPDDDAALAAALVAWDTLLD